MIIAVDGPTASGKGTIARALGEHFGLPVLDTGLLYRAVGKLADDRGAVAARRRPGLHQRNGVLLGPSEAGGAAVRLHGGVGAVDVGAD